MRILFISKYNQLYGANRSLLTIVEYFHKQNENVCVMLPSAGDMGNLLIEKNIKCITIPYFSQILYYKRSLKFLLLPILFVYDILIFPIILYKVYKFKPDIIYSNAAAENLGIFISKSLNIKHISHIREFMDLDFKAKFIGGNKLRERFLNLSNGLIFVSKSVQKHVMNNNLDASKQIVIYNGIDFPNIDFKEKELTNNLNLGIVGILDIAKRQDLAIIYFSELLKARPNLKLHIWGDKESTYKTYIINLIRKLNIQNNVIFHGFEKQTNKIYESMDILLMFSYAEGFGRVTVEAMSFGVPVIGFNNAGTTEIIKDKRNGYLFNTKEEFIQCFEELISNNSIYNYIRKNAFYDSRKEFNKTLYTERIYKFTNETLTKI